MLYFGFAILSLSALSVWFEISEMTRPDIDELPVEKMFSQWSLPVRQTTQPGDSGITVCAPETRASK
jgi:hypothetical protein